MAFTEVFEATIFGIEQPLGLMYIGMWAPSTSFPPSQTSGYETTSNLAVPAGAVVDRAVVRVAASAPNSALISEVATVRSASGDPSGASNQMIIDFGVMRNVSGLQGPVSITQVAPWLGTSFGGDDNQRDGGSDAVTLQEFQTERLLVTYASTVSAAAVGACTVLTATAPADLELTVAGSRAWFRQGTVPANFSAEVDITVAVQTAVTAGTSPVPVVLKSRIPGHLELGPVGTVQYLRTHVVAFDRGETTIVDADAEGEIDVVLPLPAASTGWTIHRVVGTVVAEDRGPERIDPPVGPPAFTDAELTLDPDRRIVVRLPADVLNSFAALAAVRVRLHAAASGIGVVGGLLTGTQVAPDTPLPGGEVVEVSVDATPSSAWVTLRFSKPLTLPSDGTLWLSLAATRGRAILGLRSVGVPGDPGRDVDESEIALIRRIAPNGVARPMSAPIGMRTDALAMRLVGTAPDGQPIDLVDIGLAALGSAGSPVALETTSEPSDGPTRFVRALVVPSPVADLRVRATLTAPTRLTIGPVVVAYEETEGAEA